MKALRVQLEAIVVHGRPLQAGRAKIERAAIKTDISHLAGSRTRGWVHPLCGVVMIFAGCYRQAEDAIPQRCKICCVADGSRTARRRMCPCAAPATDSRKTKSNDGQASAPRRIAAAAAAVAPALTGSRLCVAAFCQLCANSGTTHHSACTAARTAPARSADAASKDRNRRVSLSAPAPRLGTGPGGTADDDGGSSSSAAAVHSAQRAMVWS